MGFSGILNAAVWIFIRDEKLIKVLVAAPNSIRDSLIVVLKSMKDIQVVDIATDTALALMMVRETRPSLILVDAGFEIGAIDFIRQIKKENHLAKCIVLVDTVERHRQAVEAGANGILFKGFSVAQLKEMVAHLYPEIFEKNN
jgi:DNA-binding NarL/FixJ family response regulator